MMGDNGLSFINKINFAAALSCLIFKEDDFLNVF